jgi:pentose-5-phosphate-3-epimerase
MIFTPAILSTTFKDLVTKLFMLEGVCEQVQIDLCDGVFGLEKTWLPYKEDEELPTGFAYEFDLMVNDWRKFLPRVVALGATRVVMHIDTMTDNEIEEIVAIVRPHFIYLGLSVSNDKNVPAFAARVRNIDALYSKVFIQVMGIKNIGAQGQPFDDGSLRRIEYLKDTCRGIDIQVDGSMNPETILKVKNRGASGVVIGSYLFSNGATHDDIRNTLYTLKQDFR